MFIKVKESKTDKTVLLNCDLVRCFVQSGNEIIVNYGNEFIRLAHTLEEIESKLLPQNKKTKND